MPISTDHIAKLISMGASAVVDSEGRSVDNLAHLASLAAEKGATLTIRNAAKKSTEDLTRLAEAGGSKVVLDLT